APITHKLADESTDNRGKNLGLETYTIWPSPVLERAKAFTQQSKLQTTRLSPQVGSGVSTSNK
ncbi:MAG: hypothetical protein EB003_13910, partial [Flavobacteriia bacterium]|nr:hypothetical protein [Flavobacteriia bacterium]